MKAGTLEIEILANLARLQQGMTDAQSMVGRGVAGMMRALDLVKTAFGALGVGLSAAGIVAFAQTGIKALSDLYDMSLKTGLAVETLSALKGVAKLAGTDLETVGTMVAKLESNMLQFAQNGGGKAATAFAQLGYSQKQVKEGLQNIDAFLPDFAKRLVATGVGGEQVALAIQLMGKSASGSLPFLHQLAETSQLQAKVTTEQAAAAKQFEDNLIRLKTGTGALAVALANELLPTLNKVTEAMLRAKQGGAGWLGQIATGLETLLTGDDLHKANVQVVELTDKKLRLENEYLKALSKEKDGYVPPAQILSAAQWKKQLDEVNAALATTIGYRKQLTAEQEKEAALPRKALEDPIDLEALKATFDARIAMNNAALSVAKDSIARESQINEAYRKAELMSDEQFFANKRALMEAEQRKQIELLTSNLNLAKGIESAAAKEQDRAKAQAGVAQAEAALTKARLDGAVKRQLIGLEELAADRKRAAEFAKILQGRMQVQEEADAAFAAEDAKKSQAVLSAGEYLKQLQFEISLIGQSSEAREAENAIRALTLAGIDKESEGYRSLVANIRTSIQARSAAQAIVDFDKQIKQLEFETTLLGLSNVEREKSIALRSLEASAIDKQSAAYGELVTRMLAAIDANAAKRKLVELGDTITDALMNGFNAAKSGIHAFLDWLKAEFLKTELRPLIKMGVTAALGALGLGSGTASASELGPILGSIGKLLDGFGTSTGFGMRDRSLGGSTFPELFEKFLGDNAPLLKGLGQVAGGIAIGLGAGGALARAIGGDDVHPLHSIIGTVVGGVIGYIYGGAFGAQIGAAAGGVAGGILDGILNEGPQQRTGSVGAGPGDYTYSSSSKFGDYGILRGSDEHFSDADMSQTLNGWFRAIDKLDTEVARHFSPAEINAAADLLASRNALEFDFGIEHTNIDPEIFATMVRQRYGVMFSAIDQQMADLIAGFKGSGEDLVTLIIDLSTIHERLTGLHASLATLFGQEVGFSDIAALKGDTEGYTEALQRLAGEYGVTNQIAEMLGKTQEEVWGAIGLASEGARAHLIALAGGLDKLSGQLDFYYTHFYTTGEQQAHTLATLQQAFSDVGVAMPMTVDGFREITDRFLGMGEAGAQASASMLALAPSFYAYIGAIEAVDSAIKGNADTFKMIFGEAISTDAIRGLQQNGEVLTATLTRITSEFAATNELLSMFGLTSAQVFGAFGLASEAARSHLIELSGGLDAFTANLSSFYQNYFTDEERHQRSLTSLQGTFESLGLAMPTTTDGFRDIVEQQLALGPSGAKAAAALLGVQQAFFDLYGEAEKTTGRLMQDSKTRAELQANLFDLSHTEAEILANNRALKMAQLAVEERAQGLAPGTLTSIQALIDAQIDLNTTAGAAQDAHDALVKLNEALTNSFRDAYRSIELAGLSNQEQYRYLQKEAAGYVTNLQGATTGDQVQNWAEKIKADMLAAFNLLDPGEQLNRKQEYLDNLLRVQDIVTSRLGVLDPLGTLGNKAVDPAAAAGEVQSAAANTQREAAELNRETAALNKEAAELQVEAAKANLIATQAIQKARVGTPKQPGPVEAGA